MRVTVVHDVQGKILAVAASPPDSGVMYLEAGLGQRAVEIGADAMPSGLVDGPSHEQLSSLMEGHHIDVTEAVARLSKD